MPGRSFTINTDLLKFNNGPIMMLLFNKLTVCGITVLTGFLVINCQPKNQETSQVLKEDSTTQVPVKDTTTAPVVQDKFMQAAQALTKSFPNYNTTTDQLVDTLEDLSEHWLFKTIEKRRVYLQRKGRRSQLIKLPLPVDYWNIKMIMRSSLYLNHRRTNEFVMEKWVLKDSASAERWRALLDDSLRTNTYTKPPRDQWVEGNELYLVSTRSAQQWFEHKDQLMELLQRTP